ncbi:MAG: hypothetical protein MZV64_22790 [Ignavibacteriales bacterium]|nr:hypothetical protein [Ignavibacteriales bacterium]
MTASILAARASSAAAGARPGRSLGAKSEEREKDAQAGKLFGWSSSSWVFGPPGKLRIP